MAASEIDGEFSEREKDIILFVEKRQGCSKQDIVNQFAGKYSRVPLLKSVDDLEKLGMLIVRPSEQNRQTSAVFTNDKSVLVATFDQLNEFESSFFALIDRLAATGKTHYPMPEGMGGLVQSVPVLYDHFVGMCLLHAFLDWPRDVKDPVIASRLYNLLFSTLYDISVRLADASERLDINLSNSILRRYWQLAPVPIAAFRKLAKQFGIEQHLEDTLNQLWKLSKNYAPYMSPEFKKGFWEQVRNGVPPPESMTVFDRLNDQLNYWNEDIRTAKKKKTGLRPGALASRP